MPPVQTQSEVTAPIVQKIDLLAAESSLVGSPGAQMVEVDSPASLPMTNGAAGIITENSSHVAGPGPFAVKLFSTETIQQRPSSRGAVGF
jgi:hypothetical protein